jgi:5'-nucleotidase
MIILVDLDDTGFEWSDGFDEYIAHHPHVVGIPTRYERTTFRFYDALTPEVRSVVYKIMDTPGFYRTLKPIEGWVQAMHEMEEAGHDVRLVTSPWWTNPTGLQDKADSVAEHLGERWRSRIIFTGDKTMVMGDILIDDKPEITGIYEPVWAHILFDQHFNRDRPQDRLLHWSQWRTLLPEEA